MGRSSPSHLYADPYKGAASRSYRQTDLRRPRCRRQIHRQTFGFGERDARVSLFDPPKRISLLKFACRYGQPFPRVYSAVVGRRLVPFEIARRARRAAGCQPRGPITISEADADRLAVLLGCDSRDPRPAAIGASCR